MKSSMLMSVPLFRLTNLNWQLVARGDLDGGRWERRISTGMLVYMNGSGTAMTASAPLPASRLGLKPLE
jgi:hypothetical protein